MSTHDRETRDGKCMELTGNDGLPDSVAPSSACYPAHTASSHAGRTFTTLQPDSQAHQSPRLCGRKRKLHCPMQYSPPAAAVTALHAAPAFRAARNAEGNGNDQRNSPVSPPPPWGRRPAGHPPRRKETEPITRARRPPARPPSPWGTRCLGMADNAFRRHSSPVAEPRGTFSPRRPCAGSFTAASANDNIQGRSDLRPRRGCRAARRGRCCRRRRSGRRGRRSA